MRKFKKYGYGNRPIKQHDNKTIMVPPPAEATANWRTNEPAQFWRAGEPLSAPHPPSDITPRQSEGERLSRSMQPGARRAPLLAPLLTSGRAQYQPVISRAVGATSHSLKPVLLKSRGEHLGPGLDFRNLLPLEPRISWNARAQVGLTRASPGPAQTDGGYACRPSCPQSSGASDVDATALVLLTSARSSATTTRATQACPKRHGLNFPSRPDPGCSAAGKITGVTLSPCQLEGSGLVEGSSGTDI